MSNMQQSRATLSCKFAVQKCCLGNYLFSIGKQSSKNMASTHTDDDIIISSTLQIAPGASGECCKG